MIVLRWFERLMDWTEGRPALGCLVGAPFALVVMPTVLAVPILVAAIFQDGLRSNGMSDGWSLVWTLAVVLLLGWTHRLAHESGREAGRRHERVRREAPPT